MIDQDYVCALNNNDTSVIDVWPNGTIEDLIDQLDLEISPDEIMSWRIEEWKGKHQFTYLPAKVSNSTIVWKKVYR